MDFLVILKIKPLTARFYHPGLRPPLLLEGDLVCAQEFACTLMDSLCLCLCKILVRKQRLMANGYNPVRG